MAAIAAEFGVGRFDRDRDLNNSAIIGPSCVNNDIPQKRTEKFKKTVEESLN